jgi:hypothetical protein
MIFNDQLAVIRWTTFFIQFSECSIYHSSGCGGTPTRSLFNELISPSFSSEIRYHIQVIHQSYLLLPKNGMS